MPDNPSLVSYLLSIVEWTPLHLVILFVAIQRIVELRIARRNARAARQRGALEFGHDQYPAIVTLHALWFVGMIVEIVVLTRAINPLWYVFLVLFAGAQWLRYWAIRSLGPQWNTRILIVPGERTVRRGPYKWLRHPNYIAVIIELAVMPLMLGAYLTAATVTLLNLLLLRIRIRTEVQALRETAKGYEKVGRGKL